MRKSTRKTPAKAGPSTPAESPLVSGVTVPMTKQQMGHIEKTNAVRAKHGVTQQETGDAPNPKTPTKRGREEEGTIPLKDPKKQKQTHNPLIHPPKLIVHSDDKDVQPDEFDPAEPDPESDSSMKSDTEESHMETFVRVANFLLANSNHKLSFEISGGDLVLLDDTVDCAFNRMSVEEETVTAKKPKSTESPPSTTGTQFTLIVPGRQKQQEIHFGLVLTGGEMMEFNTLSQKEQVDYLLARVEIGVRYAYSHDTKKAYYKIN